MTDQTNFKNSNEADKNVEAEEMNKMGFQFNEQRVKDVEIPLFRLE